MKFNILDLKKKKKIVIIGDSLDKLTRLNLSFYFDIVILPDWVGLLNFINNSCDLLLIDLSMPGIKIEVVINFIIQNIKNRTFKILLFSDLSEDKLSKYVKKLNIDGYIRKENNLEKLINNINFFLN